MTPAVPTLAFSTRTSREAELQVIGDALPQPQFGIAQMRSGRNPCSTFRCWQRRHPRVPFPSWRRCHDRFLCPSSSIWGNPRSCGSDGDGAPVSFSFMKASSCMLVVSSTVVSMMLFVLLVWFELRPRVASVAVFLFCLG